MLRITDVAEIREAMNEIGYGNDVVDTLIEDINNGVYSLSDVADLIEAAEAGDDDEWFMSACFLGLA